VARLGRRGVERTEASAPMRREMPRPWQPMETGMRWAEGVGGAVVAAGDDVVAVVEVGEPPCVGTSTRALRGAL